MSATEAPVGVRRIGVLGGTFDPPHLGHLVLAAAARATLGLDRVLFIPAGDPWRKRDQRVSAAADRLAMVRAAAAGLDWARVDDREVRRPGPSYSAETLAELLAEQTRARPPGRADGAMWWLVGGADLLVDLPHWHEPAALLAHCRLAIAQRPGGAVAARAVPGMSAAEVAALVDRVVMPALDLSSTALRERCRAGEAPAVLLPAGVREVIRERGLYRAEGAAGA